MESIYIVQQKGMSCDVYIFFLMTHRQTTDHMQQYMLNRFPLLQKWVENKWDQKKNSEPKESIGQ